MASDCAFGEAGQSAGAITRFMVSPHGGSGKAGGRSPARPRLLVDGFGNEYSRIMNPNAWRGKGGRVNGEWAKK